MPGSCGASGEGTSNGTSAPAPPTRAARQRSSPARPPWTRRSSPSPMTFTIAIGVRSERVRGAGRAACIEAIAHDHGIEASPHRPLRSRGDRRRRRPLAREAARGVVVSWSGLLAPRVGLTSAVVPSWRSWRLLTCFVRAARQRGDADHSGGPTTATVTSSPSRGGAVGVCMTPDQIRPAMVINKGDRRALVVGYTPLQFRDTFHMLAEGKVNAAPFVTPRWSASRASRARSTGLRSRRPRDDPHRSSESGDRASGAALSASRSTPGRDGGPDAGPIVRAGPSVHNAECGCVEVSPLMDGRGARRIVVCISDDDARGPMASIFLDYSPGARRFLARLLAGRSSFSGLGTVGERL